MVLVESLAKPTEGGVGVGRSEVWGKKKQLPVNQRMGQENNKKMQPCDIISEGIAVLSTDTPGYNTLIAHCNFLFNTIMFIHFRDVNCTICSCC